MHEVEVKLRAQGFDAAALLQAHGARLEATLRQVDTYYQHPDRDFAATDEALRLRDVDGVLELTYKGPRTGGAVKSREEHNVTIEGDPRPLLDALGFEEGPTVRKTRQVWFWGDVAIAVDEVDGLGRFVEVEVVSEDAGAAATMVEEAVQVLGLGQLERIADSYLELQETL